MPPMLQALRLVNVPQRHVSQVGRQFFGCEEKTFALGDTEEVGEPGPLYVNMGGKHSRGAAIKAGIGS